MIKKNLSSLFILATTSMLFALPSKIGETSYKASSINSLDFNLSWEDVQFEPANNNEITVEIYCNKKKYAPTVSLSSDTLIIESVPSTQLLFVPEQKRCTVIVKVPQGKSFNKFHIHTSSGDIKSSISFNAEKINLEASSGDIDTTNQISSKEAVIQTSSGNSFISNISTNKLTAQASSGNLKIDKANSKTAQINTSSGNIKLSQFQADSLYSSASSGNITAKDLDCQSFDVSTTSGTIGIELLNAPGANSKTSSSSGTQFISLPQGSRFTLDVSTSSGSFTNMFTKDKITSHANYYNAINGGGAKISMSSSSGSITVDIGNGVAAKSSSISDLDEGNIPVVIFGDEK